MAGYANSLKRVERAVKKSLATRRTSARQPAVMDEHSSTGSLLSLQRAAGNRAVQRLIQTKLNVSASGDKHEREADAVATRVMRMPSDAQAGSAAQQQAPAKTITPILQREGEGGATQVGGNFERSVSERKGGGQPMPAELRSDMEARFGADFSAVRIHADTQAAKLAQSVSAQAFTYGKDIYLGGGKYQPRTDQGRHLLAHELTHVIQQTGAASHAAGVQNNEPGLVVNQIDRKRVKRQLDFIKMKRRRTSHMKDVMRKLDMASHDPGHALGHWWTELGGYHKDRWKAEQSYGWWPAKGKGALAVDRGERGLLNGVGKVSKASNERDPNHNEPGEEEFHPALEVDEDADYQSVEKDLSLRMRDAVRSFRGQWVWRNSWAKNSHMMQEQVMRKFGMQRDASLPVFYNPHALMPQAEVTRSVSMGAFEHVREAFKRYSDFGGAELDRVLASGEFSIQDWQDAFAVDRQEQEARAAALAQLNPQVTKEEILGRVRGK